jgi:hypothetical protein
VHKDKLELFYGQAQKPWLPDPMSARNYGLLGEQSLVATSVSTLTENYNVTTAELAAMGSAVDSIPIEVDYTDEQAGGLTETLVPQNLTGRDSECCVVEAGTDNHPLLSGCSRHYLSGSNAVDNLTVVENVRPSRQRRKPSSLDICRVESFAGTMSKRSSSWALRVFASSAANSYPNNQL